MIFDRSDRGVLEKEKAEPRDKALPKNKDVES